MGLKKFESRQVAGSRIKIVGAGDGLSDALDIEPIELTHGAEVFVLLRTTVRDVDFVPRKKGDYSILDRAHVLSTEQAVALGADDLDMAKLILANEADRIQRAKDSMVGQRNVADEGLDTSGEGKDQD